MPRIAVCTNYADRNDSNFSGENEHYDFCKTCYKNAEIASLANDNNAPIEAVDRDVEHPDYETWEYECFCCHRILISADND